MVARTLRRASAPCTSLLACLLSVAGTATPASAAPELLTNGDFSSYTVNGQASTTSYIVTGGQTSGSTGATLAGWTNQAYAFVFQPNTASSTGAVINANTRLNLWGPDGGTGSAAYSNNGFTNSPTGGAFLASDGAYQQGPIYQTVNNLVVGQSYALSFWWAAAQQSGFDGATTEGWSVYWADASYNVVKALATDTVTTPNHGFTPWRQQVYTLVATTTSMTVAFLATGGPNGTPPFSLLDGVSLTAGVPEPGTLVLLGVGLVGLTAYRLRRQAKA